MFRKQFQLNQNKAWKSVSMGALIALGLLAFQHIGHSQTTSTTGQSDYIFRFNTGISGVFIANSTFPRQQPINLGSCTATEMINGPLICATNCSNQPVCLLDVTGPSGSTVSDVLEVVSETPSTATPGATPGATASPSPAPSALPGIFGLSSKQFRSATDKASTVSKRIEAYNTARSAQ